MTKINLEVTPRERDTLLAALRLWQEHLNFVLMGRSEQIEDLMEIATNGDQHSALNNGEIDRLAEAINIGPETETEAA